MRALWGWLFAICDGGALLLWRLPSSGDLVGSRRLENFILNKDAPGQPVGALLRRDLLGQNVPRQKQN